MPFPNRQGDDAGHFMAVVLPHHRAKIAERRAADLGRQQAFPGFTHFASPTVDRAHAGQQIDAGREAGFNQHAGDRLGFVRIRHSDIDKIRHDRFPYLLIRRCSWSE